MTDPIGLYIHVPFCAKKCPYCDFYSEKYNKSSVNLYTDAVIRNISKYSGQNIRIDSIYFGGGTPTLLSPLQIDRILSAIDSTFALVSPEITIEANPVLNAKELFSDFHNAGINRISFGVESLNDRELIDLGRNHNSETAKTAILHASEAGFINISADLMLGIKNQTMDSLSASIMALAELPVNHISSYILKIEENTPFNNRDLINSLPSEDMVCDLYLECVSLLKEHGFFQYEISNFSKQGYESRHNLHYWNCDEYIGIGPASHSYFSGKRYCVERSLEQFNSDRFQKEIITDYSPGQFQEYTMLKIRLMSGINLDYCKAKYDINIEEIIKKAILLQKIGYLKIKNNTISLTPSGCLVSNQIILNLFG